MDRKMRCHGDSVVKAPTSELTRRFSSPARLPTWWSENEVTTTYRIKARRRIRFIFRKSVKQALEHITWYYIFYAWRIRDVSYMSQIAPLIDLIKDDKRVCTYSQRDHDPGKKRRFDVVLRICDRSCYVLWANVCAVSFYSKIIFNNFNFLNF